MVARNRRVQVSDMFHLNSHYICLLVFVLSFANVNAIPPNRPNAGDILQDNQNIDQAKAGQNVNMGNIANLDPMKKIPLNNVGDPNLLPGRQDPVFRNALRNPVGGGNPKNNIMPQVHKNVLLATHEDCQDDVAQFCDTQTLRKNNFAILDCLQGDEEIQSRVSEKCQHLIWTYKQNLTKDDRFDSGASEVCSAVFQQIDECRKLPEGTGVRIPCLIEHMDNISDNKCLKFLNKMANIVFADYRLVYHFMENCRGDIEKYSCGRLGGDDGPERQHLQGNTILCLARKITELDEQCKKQVLRVAELQSDDYHLDRPLYYACRDARETLCESVHAGGGKVFDCLLKHKNDAKMDDGCKELLTVRQQLIAEDVKVKKTFFEACEKDMVKNHCIMPGGHEDSHAKRSMVLLCLENVLKKNMKVSPTCIAEMTEIRRSLMEDYQITPEIVIRCEDEIATFCNNGLDRGGKTIHCLMEAANPMERKKNMVENKEFRAECRAALEDLLKEADVGSDYTVDRVLAEACQEVLEHDCQNAGEAGVINCLMEKVDSDHMTNDCEDRLLEIQYFIVRDFKLDNELYKQCHKDAVELCNAPQDWVNVNTPGASNSPMIFPCLYRHMKHDEEGSLSKPCEHEVRKVMRRRAKRIDLEPEIEEECLTDLGALCSDQETYGKGEEMECLQDHLEDIENDKCEELVRQFTEDADEDLDLDTVLMRACTPMIKKFCDDLLKEDAEASDVMDCLVENKLNHEMNVKCRAGIEHHQLIQLKDFRFSHKFKEACKEDAQTYCRDKRNKTDIVACLSEKVRDDVLKEDKHRVSGKCRNQLRVEVLNRGETIDLDPELKAACKDSINEYCKSRHAGNAQVIECLKDHKNKLTPKCHKKLFQRELDEVLQGGDFLLFRECKQMIRMYCDTKGPGEIFDCLKKKIGAENFDSKCRGIVLKRAMQETKDYRLNPSLAKSCRLDIPKFCREIVNTLDDHETSNVEFEGKVINCLKINFLKKKLSRECHDEIKTLVRETHLDINMDPVLMHACETQIRTYCQRQVGDVETNSLKFVPNQEGDLVQQCLEEKLMEGKIPQTSQCGREISRVIEEAHVDVNVDPQLNTACQEDLLRWCRDVENGEGQKMSCLLTVLEDYPDKMKAKCSTLLAQRKTLWEYAAKYAPAESLSELSDQVMQSPAKNYLLGVLMTIVGIIFIVGITCGRVTKRVTREQKTK